MIVEALSAVYGAAATWRRKWYAAPARAKHLARPVISVGNLRVGGSGKTPAVACLARLLQAQGERPAILSRGYAREQHAPGVTVVSDPGGVKTSTAQSGDEPMLLARALPGVPVLVCADRYQAGLAAERQFGTTVHILDDGFQHVALARDIDLLLADEQDLDDRVLPAGRLREPLANAAAAHALIVPGGDAGRARKIGERLRVARVFRANRTLGAPRLVVEPGTQNSDVRGQKAEPGIVNAHHGAPVFAVAGIARPERFFDDLRAAGYTLAGQLEFRDHHRFTQADVARIEAAARAGGAAAVLTTEKDAVRLESLALPDLPFLAVPLLTTIDPSDAFADWLLERLASARAAARG